MNPEDEIEITIEQALEILGMTESHFNSKSDYERYEILQEAQREAIRQNQEELAAEFYEAYIY